METMNCPEREYYHQLEIDSKEEYERGYIDYRTYFEIQDMVESKKRSMDTIEK